MTTTLDRQFARVSVRQWTSLLCLLLLLLTVRELLDIDDTVPDFVATQTGIEMVVDGQGDDLYDLDRQTQYQAKIDSRMTDAGALLPFVNPAFYLVPFLPLAATGPDAGRGIAIVVTAALTVGWAAFAHRRLPETGVAVAVYLPAMLVYQPLLENTFQPQNSIFTLWLLTLAYVAFTNDQEFRAGIWLGFLAFKPQLALPFLVLILLKRRWAAVRGVVLSGAIAAVVSVALTGIGGAVDYVELLLGDQLDAPNMGIAVEAMHNWRAFFRVAIGDGNAATVLTAVASLLLVGVLALAWRGEWTTTHPRFSLQWAATVAVTLSISPHMHRHDLSVLLLAVTLLLGVRHRWGWPQPSIAAAAVAAGHVLALGADNATSRLSIVVMPVYMAALTLAAVWMVRTSAERSPRVVEPSRSP